MKNLGIRPHSVRGALCIDVLSAYSQLGLAKCPNV
jgi:hypothetical protein